MKGRGWIVVIVAALVGAAWWFGRGGRAEVPGAAAREDTASRTAAARLEAGARHRLDRDVRKEARATISGRVSSAEGEPIGGSRVCAMTGSQDLDTLVTRQPVCATTDPRGYYTLEGLFAVTYRISASAAGHQPAIWADPEMTEMARKHDIRLSAGLGVEGIDLVLEAGGVLVNGVIKDLSGGTIAGAWVRAAENLWGNNSAWSAVSSDDEGRFELWVAPGPVSLSAVADGYTQASKTGVAPGQTFELLLTPASTLVGRVVLAGTDQPVEGARVVAAPTSFFGGGRPVAMSAADGTFRIEGIEPGRFKVEASTTELFGMSTEAVHLGLVETSDPLVVEVHPAFAIEGFVMIAGSKEPCPGGWVRFESQEGNGDTWTTLEPEGKVTARALQPGTYDVVVTCEGYAPKEKYDPVVISDASVEGVVWEVDVGASLGGVVVHADGTPAEGVNVRAQAVGGKDAKAASRSAWSREKTSTDGRFELAGLLPGKYQLDVSGRQAQKLASKPEIELAPDERRDDLRLELQAAGALEGFVRDAQGQPVGGATVRAQDEGRIWTTTTTRDDGSFHFKQLTVGSVRVQAQRSWQDTMRAPGQTDDDVAGERVTVEAGRTTRVDLVVEARDGVIRGRVLDADGGPVPDAFVDVQRESDSATKSEGSARRQMAWGWSRQPVLTDMDGNFAVEELAEGTYVVKAYRQGGGEGVIEGVSTGSTVDVTLDTPGTIEGTVSFDGGAPPDRFTINLRNREAGVHVTDTFFRTEGTWRLTNVAEGRYEVLAQTSDGDGEAQVELAPGESKSGIAITLTGRVSVRGKVVDLETGEPVPNVRVRISRRGGTTRFSMGAADEKGLTDEAGRFELDRVPTGPASATVVPKAFGVGDYGFTWTSIVIPSGAGVVELPPIEVARKRLEDGEAAGSLGLKLKENAPDEEPEDRRLVVAVVRPGGAAAEAGVKPGDEIVKVDGHEVTGAKSSLFHALTRAPAGRTVTLGLADGRDLAVTLGPPE